jgi:hypothetical protein
MMATEAEERVDETLAQKLADFRRSQEAAVKAMQLPSVK